MTPSTRPRKSVLITGCSVGGLGAALALAFQKRGYVVFATARSPAKIPTTLLDLPNVHALPLDVTSDKSVYAAVKSVKATLGGKGLDVLFNNGGLGYSSGLLDLDLERAKQLYEVNLWGVIRTTQAFANLVIEAKGAIVNQGSISGESYEPFNSIYGSSKTALAIAGEAWRLELQPLGVRVITIQTGVVESGFFEGLQGFKLPETSYYRPIEDQLRRRAEGNAGYKAMRADLYAEQVARDVDSGKNGKIWRGTMAAPVKYMMWWLPTWVAVSGSKSSQLVLHNSPSTA
ncbi:short-chain dehydrogenase reductase family [Trichoderma arundinaceum]|uniref:Short-chain dehydrogenase reductase family n=1 Tax=Trichoderma arundinaceum TaxID=490622 RepID=A0A395P181_TRIAR|nr:short-chain dehydrogenase reductase family [Trichoderma arundinaceum]